MEIAAGILNVQPEQATSVDDLPASEFDKEL
jgi:hypothetical protein